MEIKMNYEKKDKNACNSVDRNPPIKKDGPEYLKLNRELTTQAIIVPL